MPQDIILQLVSTRYWDLLKGMYATDFNKSQVLPENKINERSSEISVKDLYIIPENNWQKLFQIWESLGSTITFQKQKCNLAK